MPDRFSAPHNEVIEWSIDICADPQLPAPRTV